MNKDPAFLFYSSDFLVGTMIMTNEEVGKYIRILSYMHTKGGYITEEEVFQFCNETDKKILSKFNVDDEGIYYNERLLSEITKRSKYSESRRTNRNSKKEEKDVHMIDTSNTYDLTQSIHMENENEDIIINDSLSSSLKENTYKDIIDYLNLKSKKNFRIIAQTKKLIDVRLKEGFTIEDFYTVIDNQCAKWLSDEKMIDYLRPQTLFSNKFESYLNAKFIEPKNNGKRVEKISNYDQQPQKEVSEDELAKLKESLKNIGNKEK